MRSFQQLEVWRLSHELTLRIYRITGGFPAAERYGLSGQLRRSVSAIPANVAEGSMARHAPDFARSVNIAEKEAAEATYHVILARDLGYVESKAAEELLEELDHVRRMLNRLRQYLTGPAPAPASPANSE